MLEAVFAGPVMVVDKVIGPEALEGEPDEMWIEELDTEDDTDTGLVPMTLEDTCDPG